MIVLIHNDNKSNKTVKISPFPPFLFIQLNNTLQLEKDNNPPNVSTDPSLSLSHSEFKIGKYTSILHHIIRPHTPCMHTTRTSNI